MLNLEEVSSRPEPCRRCGSRFKVALPRRPSELEQLAQISSQGYTMELIRLLRALTGCSLADAKGTVQHLASKPGTCHRCSRSIPLELLVSDCPFCGSLNLQLDLTFPCPVCGFLVLSEAYGCFDICPVCGWEDDGLQLANPTSRGGANSESLAEAQTAALQEYPLTQVEADGFTRSTLWRPLSPEEIERFEEKRKIEHWHARGVLELAEVYWMRE